MEAKGTYVNSKVRRLAEHLDIDPEVAQTLYLNSDLGNAIDGLEYKGRKEELDNLRALKKALVKHAHKFERHDVIQTAFRIDGFDLQKTLTYLVENLDDMIGFGEQKIREETSGTRSVKRANEVALYVAELFKQRGNNVGYGREPLNGKEPSTPFGRAVREALYIFEVYETPTDNVNELQIVHWRSPTQKAAEQYRNPKST